MERTGEPTGHRHRWTGPGNRGCWILIIECDRLGANEQRLGVLRGAWGWTLLWLIWSLALLGILLTVATGIRHPAASAAVYLAMGWLVVIAARPLWLGLPGPGLALLAAGGLAYTLGVGFFVTKRLPFGHFVWHLFVLAGTTCHFFAVMWYAA